MNLTCPSGVILLSRLAALSQGASFVHPRNSIGDDALHQLRHQPFAPLGFVAPRHPTPLVPTLRGCMRGQSRSCPLLRCMHGQSRASCDNVAGRQTGKGQEKGRGVPLSSSLCSFRSVPTPRLIINRSGQHLQSQPQHPTVLPHHQCENQKSVVGLFFRILRAD